MSIRFDDQVAIITGAGHGLGKSHALELAKRGAKIVVNDLGGDVSGEGSSDKPAQQVVKQIIDAGGEATANGADVCNYDQVQEMVQQTMDKWGRVDILINNAGILRDKSFGNMEPKDFKKVIDVHLNGAMHCTKAVWNIMKKQNYGRILMTSSPSGLWGNFGQANYASAKLGLVGFMNNLKIEGQKYNIYVNAIAPAAATRMTRDLMPPDALEALAPEFITAGVIYLVSSDAPNGEILENAGGFLSTTRMCRSKGIILAPNEMTPENIAKHWQDISDQNEQQAFFSSPEATATMFSAAADHNGDK